MVSQACCSCERLVQLPGLPADAAPAWLQPRREVHCMPMLCCPVLAAAQKGSALHADAVLPCSPEEKYCPVLAADQNWNVVPLCPGIPGQEYLYVIRQRVGAVAEHHTPCMVACWGPACSVGCL